MSLDRGISRNNDHTFPYFDSPHSKYQGGLHHGKVYLHNNNGLWYELQGDYYIPCLVLDEEETQPIGTWGRKRLDYLKKHRQALYTTLLVSGKLNSHLVEVDNQASEMLYLLMKQLAEMEGISEQLKAQDQMAWVQRMNNVRNRAEEIVNAEIILV